MRHALALATMILAGGCPPPADDPADAAPATPADAAPAPTTTEVLMLGNPALTVQAGGSATLALRWNALPMGEDLEVFVHFVDENGVQQSAWNGDHAPPVGTSTWSGPVAYDHVAAIPAGAPAGSYTIRVGLYHRAPPWERVELVAGPGVTVDDERRYTVGTLAIAAAPGGEAGPDGQDPDDWVRTFTEEFEGGFDTAVWNDHIWYESANPTVNYRVQGGYLEIWPERDATGAFFNRTIDTDGNYEQTYGFFEMEARLPRGKGTWPAFWIFNHLGDRRPEIDIMEAYPGGEGWGATDAEGVRIPVAYGATIWIDASVQGGAAMISTPDLSADFHTYGLKWEAGRQTFYFDGVEVYAADVAMSDPMYLMLDLWFGSASGQPDDSTPTGPGNAYQVSYVRAWRAR